jgi:hypothetical protein
MVFSFVETGLSDCINCNPVPRGTRNHPHEGASEQRPPSGGLGAPVGSGDRAKRCLNEDPAPRASSAWTKTKLKLSDDVIEDNFISIPAVVYYTLVQYAGARPESDPEFLHVPLEKSWTISLAPRFTKQRGLRGFPQSPHTGVIFLCFRVIPRIVCKGRPRYWTLGYS